MKGFFQKYGIGMVKIERIYTSTTFSNLSVNEYGSQYGLYLIRINTENDGFRNS